MSGLIPDNFGHKEGIVYHFGQLVSPIDVGSRHEEHHGENQDHWSVDVQLSLSGVQVDQQGQSGPSKPVEQMKDNECRAASWFQISCQRCKTLVKALPLAQIPLLLIGVKLAVTE